MHTGRVETCGAAAMAPPARGAHSLAGASKKKRKNSRSPPPPFFSCTFPGLGHDRLGFRFGGQQALDAVLAGGDLHCWRGEEERVRLRGCDLGNKKNKWGVRASERARKNSPSLLSPFSRFFACTQQTPLAPTMSHCKFEREWTREAALASPHCQRQWGCRGGGGGRGGRGCAPPPPAIGGRAHFGGASPGGRLPVAIAGGPTPPGMVADCMMRCLGEVWPLIRAGPRLALGGGADAKPSALPPRRRAGGGGSLSRAEAAAPPAPTCPPSTPVGCGDGVCWFGRGAGRPPDAVVPAGGAGP